MQDLTNRVRFIFIFVTFLSPLLFVILLNLSQIGPNNPLHPFPAPHFKTFKYVFSNVLNVPSFKTAISYAPNIITSLVYSLNFKSNLQAKSAFFLLNPASATEILDWISRVNIAPSNPNGWNIPHSSVLFELSKSVVGMVFLGISWPCIVRSLFHSIACTNIIQSISLTLLHSFSFST